MKPKNKARALNRRPSSRLLLFAAGCLGLLPAAGWAQYNIFVNVQGIPGESISASHPNTIEATGLSFGVTNTFTNTCSSFLDLSVAKAVDKASPQLMLRCAQGALLSQVILYVQKFVSGSPQDYLVLRLEHVQISGMTDGSRTNGPPTEVVTFRPTRVTMTYTLFDQNGGVQGNVETCFDTYGCFSCSK
jgi:type VI secretion system secreted protein Hcp